MSLKLRNLVLVLLSVATLFTCVSCKGETTKSTSSGAGSGGEAVSDTENGGPGEDGSDGLGGENTPDDPDNPDNPGGTASANGKSSGGGNQNSGGGGTASGGNQNSGGGTTNAQLVIWDDTKNTALTAAAAEYESAHKGTKIVIKQQSGNSTSFTSLKLAVASKSAPDIVKLDSVFISSSANQGYIADLGQYGVNASTTSKFADNCIKDLKYNNKLYGLPFDANTIVMVYNKKMLSEAGAAVPTSKASLLDACNKIKTKYGASAYAFSVPFDNATQKSWNSFIWFFWLWRMGGDILTPDNKTAAFNSAAGVEALQLILDMKDSGQIASSDKNSEFYYGQVGMMDTVCSVFETVFSAASRADYDVATLPSLKAGVPAYSGLGLYSYAVTSGSNNAQAAADFIKFYCTSSKYQLQYCKKKFLVPSLIEARSDSFYKATEWQVVFKQMETTKSRPSVANWDKIENAVSDAITVAFRGQSTAKEALDAAAKTVNTLLAKG